MQGILLFGIKYVEANMLNNFIRRDTTVAKIMTKGPMCVTSDTSATDALNLMVSRGFRHLVNRLEYYFTVHYINHLYSSLACL
jgi:CBS domain-containing protein